MTDQEKQEIIDQAVEKALLMIPEVVGNLMAQNAMYNKLNSQFYQDHPEFRDKKELVASVVEMVDGQNPGLEYAEILEKALPEIQNRVKLTQHLNVTDMPQTVSRDFSNGEL